MKSGLGPSVTVPSVPTSFAGSGQEVHTGVDELLTDRVRSPAHLGHLLVGDVVHRVAGERDQVLRHRMSCLSHRIDRRHRTYPRTLCMGSDRCQRENAHPPPSRSMPLLVRHTVSGHAVESVGSDGPTDPIVDDDESQKPKRVEPPGSIEETTVAERGAIR
jgi:hypothetical protein